MDGTITLADFKKIQLRTAKIIEAKAHPNADKLLVLTVDVGDRTKQICAGIKFHYPPETLVGKTIVIVDNLEPAVLRGEESQGMLLAASDGDKVVLLTVDQPTASGCEVR